MNKEEEIALLLSKASKYLEASELLLRESFLDSAISRIYYALYYTVQALLLEADITVHTHKGLITKFQEIFIKSEIFEKDLALILSEAFDKRGIADYDAFFVIDEKDVVGLLEKAHFFYQKIQQHLEKK